MGTFIDTIVDMAKGMRIILTKPMVEKIKTISNFLHRMAGITNSKEIKNAADKLSNWAKTKGPQLPLPGYGPKIDPKIVSIINRLEAIARRGLEILKKNPKSVLAGIAVASGIITAGIMIYKKYLSAGARSCKGKEGADKQKCIVQFRINAYKAEISIIRSSESKCSQSNDPMTCRKKLDDRIKSLQSRIKNLEGK
jgi:hypothetical protein